MTTIEIRVLAMMTFLSLMGITVSAEALIIRDMCNQTSGDGQGHNCPAGDYLLVRPKYSDGTCGDWMCCPANNDGSGSYNCDKATNPTSSAISGVLKNLLGPRATVLDPGKIPSTTNPQIFQNPNAPVLRRGIEGEQPAEPTPGAPTSPEQPSGTKPQ